MDGEEVNRFIAPDSLWQLRNDARPLDASLVAGDSADRFRGAHDGYGRLRPPVIHTREFAIDRTRPRVAVRDTLSGKGARGLTWRFHLDPAVTPTKLGADVRMSVGSRDVWLLASGVDVAFTVEDGWVSPSYGVRLPTKVLVWRTTESLPFNISFLFAERYFDTVARQQAIAALTRDS